MINQIFETLAANNSRNFKIDYLTQHKDNELLKEVIRLALDPFTQFYQRKIPEYTPALPNQADTLSSVVDSLSMLSSRQVTGNAAISHLTKLLSSLVESDANVIERIIQKDLKCGVSIATANAVWSGLIHEYPCMLCSAYDEKLVKKVKFPAYAQVKMDGMRFNAIVKDGKCEFRSRNGKQIDLLGNLEQEFVDLANGNNLVFDGELLLRKDGKILDRQTGNGILNKANKGTIKPQEAELVIATIWDVIPYDDFYNGKSIMAYVARYHFLKLLLENLPSDKIELVVTKQVPDLDTAISVFQQLLNDGQEGIILKDFDSIWENKRSKSQIKFKGELETDLRVVDIQMGTGKYEGMLGAIVCESSDGVVRVNVGSGFSDDQRKTIDYIGKIVAVKYNARITNKQGEESLFLPVFVEVREDKDTADSSKDVK
jgi:hypothetical protein